MPSVEAHITTDRADRYLTQLCSHLDHMSRMRHQPPAGQNGSRGHGPGQGPTPPAVEHVDHSGPDASIRFTGGLCTLHATADTLILRIDADDEDTLHRLQTALTTRLENVGRRDRLTATWHRADPAAPPGGRTARATPPAATAGRGRCRRDR